MTLPRLRLGSAGGRRLLGVGAAALLIGGLILSGRLLDGDGDSGTPVRPGGSDGRQAPFLIDASAQCPGSSPVLAMSDRLGFAVPCPGLLPGTPPSRLCDEPAACRRKEVVWRPHEGFAIPPGSAGTPGSLGSLSILGSPLPDAGGDAFQCPSQRPIATPTVGRRPAVLEACPEGFHGWSVGSVLLRWSQDGTLVAVGLRGTGQLNQRLVVTLADHLTLVAP